MQVLYFRCDNCKELYEVSTYADIQNGRDAVQIMSNSSVILADVCSKCYKAVTAALYSMQKKP